VAALALADLGVEADVVRRRVEGTVLRGSKVI